MWRNMYHGLVFAVALICVATIGAFALQYLIWGKSPTPVAGEPTSVIATTVAELTKGVADIKNELTNPESTLMTWLNSSFLTLDGKVEEVKKLLGLSGGAPTAAAPPAPEPEVKETAEAPPPPPAEPPALTTPDSEPMPPLSPEAANPIFAFRMGVLSVRCGDPATWSDELRNDYDPDAPEAITQEEFDELLWEHCPEAPGTDYESDVVFVPDDDEIVFVPDNPDSDIIFVPDDPTTK